MPQLEFRSQKSEHFVNYLNRAKKKINAVKKQVAECKKKKKHTKHKTNIIHGYGIGSCYIHLCRHKGWPT